MRVQAGSEHALTRLRRKLQDHVLFVLPRRELSMLHHLATDVFEEAIGDHNGVMSAKLIGHNFLEVVAPRVVPTRKDLVVKRRLTLRAAKIVWVSRFSAP